MWKEFKKNLLKKYFLKELKEILLEESFPQDKYQFSAEESKILWNRIKRAVPEIIDWIKFRKNFYYQQTVIPENEKRIGEIRAVIWEWIIIEDLFRQEEIEEKKEVKKTEEIPDVSKIMEELKKQKEWS